MHTPFLVSNAGVFSGFHKKNISSNMLFPPMNKDYINRTVSDIDHLGITQETLFCAGIPL